MANSTFTLRNFLIILIRTSFFCFLTAAWADGTALAQTSVTDGSTPLALSPGAPAGSYALSGFESVNAYNGNLSFRVPLLRIGGRGEAGYTVALPVERHWRVVHKSNDNQEIELPVSTAWMATGRRYEAGHLEGRLAVDRPCSSAYRIAISLSRLTFTSADGTEYELRDQLTGGQPQSYDCGGRNLQYPTRGNIFVTADGTAATFISDTTIRDNASAITPSGYLSLRDGTRYRIDSGNVSWIRDRNGNKLSFSYGAYLMTITDSLNRQVVVQYADFQTTFFDQITFKGYGGTQRNIRINFSLLHTALRTNRPGDISTVQTAAALFPQLTGSNSNPVDWHVVSSIILPDGVQQFQFLYNVYGELARATLPTGGALEYDFGNGTEGGDPTGVIWSGFSLPEIYRRVLRRRTYRDAGSTLEGLTTYSKPEGTASAYVEIDHLKSDQTTLLSRERHYFYGAASSSFSQDPLSYARWREGREYQTEYYAADGQTMLKRIDQTWDQHSLWWWYGDPSQAPANNPYLKETAITLADSGQITRTTHVNPANGQAMIDQFNNITDTWVYDYGAGVPGNLLNHTHTDYLTVNNGVDYTNRTSTTSPHLLGLPTRLSVYDAGEIERARTTYEYDNYGSSDSFHAALKDWPAITGVPISGLDASFTSSYPYRGNVTATTRYLLSNNQVSGSITGYAQFDLAGSVVKTIDARSTPGNIIASIISYDDCFGVPDADARVNSAPDRLAMVNERSYAFPTVVTNAVGQSAYTQFDYYLGRPVDAEDANGTVFSGYYNDLLDRPVKIIKASNRDISLQSQSLFAYDDVGHSVTTTSDLYSFGDQVLKNQILYDGLGRTIETRQFEGGNNYIATRRLYDALSRVYQSSNPFRPWKNELPAWTNTGFDALSRVIFQTTPDGATATTSYNGNSVTSSDQIGKKRKSVSDALGRLVQIYEDPNDVNWLTSYSYDALGDLATVNQGGQMRTFVYDSLTRLTSATNPESGTVINTYDNNGNLLTSRDARGITTNLAYDALNRLTARTYQNDPAATAPVSYFYDNQSLPAGAPPNFFRGSSIGRLVAVTYGTNSSAGDYYGYDVLGRSVLKVQRTGGTNYLTSATYGVSGRTSSLTYPSGHTLTFNYDQAGRLGDKDAQNLALTGNLGDGIMRTYSGGITYNSWNAPTQEKFGTDTPIYNKLFYNSRGQLSEIRESTSPNNTSWNRGAIINHYSNQCWGMCTGLNMTDNNGNLKRQDTYIPDNDQVSSYVTWADAFTYDSLNRLQQVHEYTSNSQFDFQQEYLYDQWGNRRINQTATWGAGIPKPDFTVNTSNNKLSAPAGYTIGYDAAGNLTNDTYTGQGQRVYDADNRMTQAWANSQWQNYTYDGNGRRVRRNVSGIETWQVYGIGGELLAEYAANGAASAPQKEYGYRNGQLLVTLDVSAATSFNGYAFRRTINIDHSKVPNTDQSNFPLLISGTYAYLATIANGGNVQNANGYDVIFTSDSGCATKLNHEVETYTSSTGAANYWVKVPTVSHTSDTAIYMCYGNANITTNQSNPAGVWDTNYKGVWHLGNGSTLSAADSTGVNNGTNHGATAGSGQVDGAAAFNGSSQYATIPLVVLTSNITLEAWVYRTTSAATGAGQDVVAHGSNGADGFGLRIGYGNTHQFLKYGVVAVDSGVASALNTWEHVVWTVQSDLKPRLYLNGVLVFTGSDTSSIVSATHEASFGDSYYLGSPSQAWFGGRLDETRLSNVVRSADWIAAEHRNQSSPGTFYGVSGATGGGGSGSADVQWLVTDQLGTPRMIFDRTGSLANTKRHDYLPFGEELSAGTGVRTGVQGYSVADGIRQKFTQKERDTETGLDYFLARYYANAQGRFTSPDPLLASGRPANPQTWNRYAYVLNNPLKFVDPNGLAEQAEPQPGEQPQTTTPPAAQQPITPPQELVNAIMQDLTEVTLMNNGQAVGNGIMQLDQKVYDEFMGAITDAYTRGVETGTVTAASNGIAIPSQLGTQSGVGGSATVGSTNGGPSGSASVSLGRNAQKTFEPASGQAVRTDIANRAANGQTVERVAGTLQGTQVVVNTASGRTTAIAEAGFWRERLTKFVDQTYSAGIEQGKRNVAAPHVLPKNPPF